MKPQFFRSRDHMIKTFLKRFGKITLHRTYRISQGYRFQESEPAKVKVAQFINRAWVSALKVARDEIDHTDACARDPSLKCTCSAQASIDNIDRLIAREKILDLNND